MKYTLDYLSEKFKEHAIKAEKNNRKSLANFVENNPEAEIPEWFLDEFSLPLALKTIVDELIQLKENKK